MDVRPPADSPAIWTSGLSRTFDGHLAVDGIELTVSRGELFALLGPNGAGKTTTIRMLCCLLRPTSGTATVQGHDIRSDPLGAKRVLDVSPQETAIAGHLDAKENLALIAGLNGMSRHETRERSETLLEVMGLTARAGDRVKHYSGGMKRRLSIAMALVSDPDVLFLDEPTLGLDPQSRRAIWAHIEALKGQKTILLTTHYLEEADVLADRIAIIDEGKIVALGTSDELKRSVFGGPTTVVEATALTDDALVALRQLYPTTRRTEDGLEIEAAEVDVYDIQDVLRPRGVTVLSIHKKQVTLDDVFLHLTGKQLRE